MKGGTMENLLLTDEFIDFVTYQMNNNIAILRNIQEYNKYNNQLSEIDKKIDKIENQKIKSFIDDILECLQNKEIYENSLAYYLGMKQTFNMEKLKK